MDNEQLKIAIQRLKNLENIARDTKSPFAKANLAEKAISEAINIIDELVRRATI